MDKETQIFWILFILAYILNHLKYLRNPINYSNKKLYFITYHNLYFALEIIILVCITIFIYLLVISIKHIFTFQNNIIFDYI